LVSLADLVEGQGQVERLAGVDSPVEPELNRQGANDFAVDERFSPRVTRSRVRQQIRQGQTSRPAPVCTTSVGHPRPLTGRTALSTGRGMAASNAGRVNGPRSSCRRSPASGATAGAPRRQRVRHDLSSYSYGSSVGRYAGQAFSQSQCRRGILMCSIVALADGLMICTGPRESRRSLSQRFPTHWKGSAPPVRRRARDALGPHWHSPTWLINQTSRQGCSRVP